MTLLKILFDQLCIPLVNLQLFVLYLETELGMIVFTIPLEERRFRDLEVGNRQALEWKRLRMGWDVGRGHNYRRWVEKYPGRYFVVYREQM